MSEKNKNVPNDNAMNVDNRKLEQAIDAFKEKGEKDQVVALMTALRSARLLLPARFPSDLSDEIKEMLRKRIQIPREKMPPLHPVLEQSQEGDFYVGVYTSRQKITNPQDYPVIINTDFDQVSRIAADKKLKIRGVILNPRTDKITLHPQFMDAMDRMNNKVKDPASGSRQVKMSRAEFDGFARKNIEHVLLPKAAFENSLEFMEDLEALPTDKICDFYKLPYGDKIPCPYKPENFDVMILDVRDDCRFVSVITPQPSGIQGCYHLCFAYNPESHAIRYFIFEKNAGEEVAMASEILSDGKSVPIGEAPSIGSEMSYILDHMYKS